MFDNFKDNQMFELVQDIPQGHKGEIWVYRDTEEGRYIHNRNYDDIRIDMTYFPTNFWNFFEEIEFKEIYVVDIEKETVSYIMVDTRDMEHFDRKFWFNHKEVAENFLDDLKRHQLKSIKETYKKYKGV